MKATIKGLERVKYTNKDKKEVDGMRLHIERKDPNVVGSYVEAVYMSTERLENLGCVIPENMYKNALGCTVEFEYNRFGMIASLAIYEPENAEAPPATAEPKTPPNTRK